MFFFNNKKEEPDKDEKSANVLNSALGQLARQEDLTKDAEIHVMPSKFLITENNSSGKKKTIMLVVVLLVIICFVAGVILFIFKDGFIKEQPALPNIPEKPVVDNSLEVKQEDDYITGEDILTDEEKSLLEETNENGEDEFLATSTDEVILIPDEEATSTEQIIATSTPEIATSTPEIATSTPEISTSTPEIATSTSENGQVLDSDKDGLTDLEEDLFSCDKLNEDFDNDGYLDGIEVINLYNPISFAPQKLSESGLVKIYNDARFNIFYPTNWTTEIIEEGNISFKSQNGEFIQLIVFPNLDSISAEDWYKIQLGMEEDVLTDFFENTDSGANKKGLYYLKINETTVYVNDYNYIYVLNYNMGATNVINFPSVFEIMMQGLESKIDTDGDSIKDYLEIDVYKTDPKNIDTDGDGFNDGEEIENKHDPLA